MAEVGIIECVLMIFGGVFMMVLLSQSRGSCNIRAHPKCARPTRPPAPSKPRKS